MVNIKISGGKSENGIIVGNSFDKYGSQNPIVKWMMSGFERALSDFVNNCSPKTIHEIGCGEGYWVFQWKKQGFDVRGCDFSKDVIEIARENASKYGIKSLIFSQKSIYDLDMKKDKADLVVCCEVLEHLEDPHLALQSLQRIVGQHLIISVPNEPLWRIFNVARGKYLTHLGNTPGHIQHWSKKDLIELISHYFNIIEVKSPLPWTMLLCNRIRSL